MYKISPDETLKITQELYEKNLLHILEQMQEYYLLRLLKKSKNIDGLQAYTKFRDYASEILASAAYKGLEKTRYVNDSKITDHYAIIPTGQGLAAIDRISVTARRVYETIARRFLSIFYPPAIYRRVNITLQIDKESFFSTFRVLEQEGYFKVAGNPSASKEKKNNNQDNKEMESGLDELAKDDDKDEGDKDTKDQSFIDAVLSLKKGMKLAVNELIIKEGETSPPKRYSSGTLILAMENAGQFIEDEELRAQIKGSGIGTSATRAEILNKLVKISYLSLNKKTQIVTPALLGELVYEVVNASIRSLLNAELTASWEKGLAYVEE